MTTSIIAPTLKPSLIERVRRERWLTILGALVAVGMFATPAFAALFEYQREQSSQLWRLLSCHFTHFDANHLFWSGSMFVLLAAMLEPRGRRRLLLCIVISALAVAGAVHFAAVDLTTYRGLSGIDSALFALLLLDLHREARAASDRAATWLHAALGLSFAMKIAYEAYTGGAVFVSADGYSAVPLAHLVGAAAGAAIGLRPSRGA